MPTKFELLDKFFDLMYSKNKGSIVRKKNPDPHILMLDHICITDGERNLYPLSRCQNHDGAIVGYVGDMGVAQDTGMFDLYDDVNETTGFYACFANGDMVVYDSAEELKDALYKYAEDRELV